MYRWTIKARITSKSDIRRWSNAKGEGTLFSIDLLDSDGGEIRATFFKEACDKFFPVLEEGKVRGLVPVCTETPNIKPVPIMLVCRYIRSPVAP